MRMLDYIQPFGTVVLFFVVLWLAYFLSKHAGTIQMKKQSRGNMSVIEAISLGPGKTLQLVRVGDEYFIIGVSKDHIQLIHRLDDDQIRQPEASQKSEAFAVVLNKFVNKKSQEPKDTMHSGEEKNHEKDF